MRIVVLSSSIYSETACAMTARLAQLGHVPVGVLALRSLHAPTILRKVGQWGLLESARYARTKLFSARGEGASILRNSCLAAQLEHADGAFRNLRQLAKYYGFPVTMCGDQNAPNSISQLSEWSPDLIIFTGGNILREQLLAVPRLGVLNAHLGLLPEIRGMSSPEWSLLNNVPVGVTIHYVDSGIDTGPILQRFEYPDVSRCTSLEDLRNRLIAIAIAKMADVVVALDRGQIAAQSQSDTGKDSQFFVMHEWLQARAAERLPKPHLSEVVPASHV